LIVLVGVIVGVLVFTVAYWLPFIPPVLTIQATATVPPNALFADDFTQDTQLNTNDWISAGSVVRAALTNFDSPPATFVQPVLSFSPTQGMEMAGITGTYEQTGIQSARAFTPPFTVMVRDMEVGASLSDARGGSGVSVAGGTGGIPEWTGFWYSSKPIDNS
jgi:hypothetical protein